MICAYKYWLVGLIALTACMPAARSENALNTNQAAIRGVVTDADGKPVASAVVKFNQYEGGHLDPIMPTATTDKDGQYELRFEMAVPIIVKQLWVTLPGYVRIVYSERFRIEPGQEVPLDFELQPGEIISGTIEAGPGNPNRVHMFRVTGNRFDQIHVTDSEGRFEFYVPPGGYVIDVLTLPGVAIGQKQVRAGTKDVLLKPHQVELSDKVLANAFDTMWESLDHNYSYFAYKPDVDWDALREAYRPRAVTCSSVDEFVELLKEMLADLRDPHVWIETEEGIVGTYGTPWQRNWNPQAIMSTWESSEQCGKFAIVGKTNGDGFGFVVINKQGEATQENVAQTVAAIAALRNVPGFIVDLRGGASGGSEPLAQELARAFCEEAVVYAKHKRRNGPDHDTFGATSRRTLPAGEKPFTRPVVCLIGQRCMSSGEALVKMMHVLPHVTTVGMTTRGASGNPQPVELPGLNARVYFSRWVDMMPNGDVYEGKGIAPDIEVNSPLEAYATSDPTWERGIEVLRSRISETAE